MVRMFALIGIASSCAVTFVHFQSCAAKDHLAVPVQDIELKLVLFSLLGCFGVHGRGFFSGAELNKGDINVVTI